VDWTCHTNCGNKRRVKILVGKPYKNSLFEKLGMKWEDNIKMDITNIMNIIRTGLNSLGI